MGLTSFFHLGLVWSCHVLSQVYGNCGENDDHPSDFKVCGRQGMTNMLEFQGLVIFGGEESKLYLAHLGT